MSSVTSYGDFDLNVTGSFGSLNLASKVRGLQALFKEEDGVTNAPERQNDERLDTCYIIKEEVQSTVVGLSNPVKVIHMSFFGLACMVLAFFCMALGLALTNTVMIINSFWKIAIGIAVSAAAVTAFGIDTYNWRGSAK